MAPYDDDDDDIFISTLNIEKIPKIGNFLINWPVVCCQPILVSRLSKFSKFCDKSGCSSLLSLQLNLT